MQKIKLSGKLSLVWLLAILAVLYTGARLVQKSKADREAAVQVFTENGSYPSQNNAIMDLLG